MRVLIVSDIHSNLPALESVLSAAGAFDTLWNLGDTVGYGPWPNECIDLVCTYPNAIHLAGNHDLAATGAIPTDGFNRIAAAAARWTAGQLTAEHRDWLSAKRSLAVEGMATLAHGSPRSPAFEYIMSSSQAAENFPYFNTRICLVGHTHVPMIAVDGISVVVERPFSPTDGQGFDLSAGRCIINPGSVGQPRDGDSRAAFALLDTDALKLVFRRVSYPIQTTQKAITDAGLPRQLADRLSFGL